MALQNMIILLPQNNKIKTYSDGRHLQKWSNLLGGCQRCFVARSRSFGPAESNDVFRGVRVCVALHVCLAAKSWQEACGANARQAQGPMRSFAARAFPPASIGVVRRPYCTMATRVGRGEIFWGRGLSQISNPEFLEL